MRSIWALAFLLLGSPARGEETCDSHAACRRRAAELRRQMNGLPVNSPAYMAVQNQITEAYNRGQTFKVQDDVVGTASLCENPVQCLERLAESDLTPELRNRIVAEMRRLSGRRSKGDVAPDLDANSGSVRPNHILPIGSPVVDLLTRDFKAMAGQISGPKKRPNFSGEGNEEERAGQEEAGRTFEQEFSSTGDEASGAAAFFAYRRAGRHDDAERVLEELVRRSPRDAGLRSALAFAKAGRGRADEARAQAREAIKLDPDSELAKLVLGGHDTLMAGASKVAGMDVGFDAKTAPQGGEPAGAQAAKLAGLTQYVGVSATPSQRENAERALASIAAGIPPAAEPRGQVQSILKQAAWRIAAGDLKGPEGALFQISRALMLAPKNVEALVLRAHVSNLPGVKNHAAAVADAEAALALQPDSAPAWFEKGYAQLQLGETRAALDSIERGLGLEPDNAMGRLYHAMALEKAGLIAKAVDEYQEAARLDPALRPVVEESLGRLAGAQLQRQAQAPAPAPSPRSVPLRLFLYALLGATALALLLEGGKRVFKKDWKTSATSGPAFAQRPRSEGTLAPGHMLGGAFRIERELARGGLGVVYVAEDVMLKRRVAIKQLNRQAVESEEVRRRFVQEAQLGARLRHENLAQVYSAVSEEGGLYLVFELVDGETLGCALQRRLRLPLPEVKKIARDVASALDYAHSQRVIHRDLKPANVMLSGGRARILDFGIAHEARSMTDATQTQAWGTPPYMAPEQEMGRVCKESDYYAMAVMLYELTTGRRPFDGPTFLEKKLAGEFVSPRKLDPALPAALDAFFKKALAPEPADRFRSAAELAEAFPAVEPTPVRA